MWVVVFLFLVTTTSELALALAGSNRETNLLVILFVQDWDAVLHLLISLRVGLIGCLA